jgi:4-amino-4-deoxy-L-arabinose transferase-like glycosyltransferase
MSIPDEFIYAVMGRNIAEFKGIYSNYYVPDAIVADGYPTGDTHMPGYSLVLAGMFWLFGSNESAAFILSQLAFILSGVAIFWVGRTVFNRQTGFWAAIWFYVLPINFIWINTVLPDPILVLLSVIFLGIWYRAVTVPEEQHSLWLALLLILGMLCRETFVIFLPPALYALWRWPRSTRLKAILIFGAVYLLGMILIFFPLNAARASYPWNTQSIIERKGQLDWVESWAALQNHIERNVKTELEVAWEPFSLANSSKYIITILVLLSGWVFEKRLWKLTFYYLFTFLSTLVIMVVLYDIFRWFGGLRIFAMLMPAGIVVACGVLSRWPIKPRYIAWTLVAVIFLGVSWWANQQMTDIRRSKFEKQLLLTQTLTQQISHLPPPKVVMAEEAFMYGWQNYPVTIIWRSTNNLHTWRALNERVKVDLIITQDPDARDRLLQAMAKRLVSNNFALLKQEPGNNYYVFVHH